MAKRDELRPEYKREDLGVSIRGKHYGEYTASLQPEKFDYTDWRQDLYERMSGREISQNAMEYQQTLQNKYSRATADMDIWIAIHPQNAEKMVAVSSFPRSGVGMQRPTFWRRVVNRAAGAAKPAFPRRSVGTIQ